MLNCNMFFTVFIYLIFYGIVYAAEPANAEPNNSLINVSASQKMVERLIQQLDADKWEERKAAKDSLQKVLGGNKKLLHFFIKTTQKSKNPEIRLSAKELLFDYYKKFVHNHAKGNGFIGLQLAPGGGVRVGNMRYSNTIRIMVPVAGFPGAKAGLKEDDIILEVDKFKCGDKFGLDDFISYVALKSPGDKIILKLVSNGKVVQKEITLAKRPDSEMASLRDKPIKELFDVWYDTIRMDDN